MSLSKETLDHNLRALEAHQPEIAQVLRHSPMPKDVVPAIGRDGTPTAMVPTAQGHAWLGGSSMPQVSAEEMFGNVNPNGGSVALPGMLTGMEAIVVARRLAPRFAVFVVDIAEAFLPPLVLHDYGGLLTDGKIVLLLSDNLPARMREFFQRNPGYALPIHVLKTPQVPAGDLANLVRALEDAGAAAQIVLQEFLTRQVELLRTRQLDSGQTSSTTAAVVGAEASPSTFDLAARIKRGLESLGGSCELCLPDGPQRCQVTARIAAIERSDAEIVFFLDGPPEQERMLLPAELPVISWCSRRTSGPGGPFDTLVVDKAAELDSARASGWPSERVFVVEPAADVAASESSVADLSAISEILVMADIPDDRPEASGVSLPSQLELWKAIQQEVLRRADRWGQAPSVDTLERAQKASGTRLADEALLESFRLAAESIIAPAIVARTMALALVKAGFRPQIWGRNWPALGRGEDLRKGEILLGDRRKELVRRPAWVVIPWYTHAGVCLALDWMAGGSAVLMYGNKNRFTSEYPQLAEAMEAVHWFHSSVELVSTLRDGMARPSAVAERARNAAQRIRAEHTVVRRLERLLGMIRAARKDNPVKESG